MSVMRKWAFLSLLLVASTAWAKIELTPQVGYRAGGLDLTTGIACVQGPCPSFARSNDDLLFGASLGIPVRGRYQVELLANRQPTTLVFSDVEGRFGPTAVRSDLDVTHLHAGLQRSWKVASFEPFVGLAAGQTWLRSEPILGHVQVDWRRFSASLAAGTKIALGSFDRYALRLEARGYWVDLPADPASNGVRGLNDLKQIETTTGLAIRF